MIFLDKASTRAPITTAETTEHNKKTTQEPGIYICFECINIQQHSRTEKLLPF